MLPLSAQEKRPEAEPLAKELPDFDVRTASAGRTAALSVEGGSRAAFLAPRLAGLADAAGQPVRYSLNDAGLPKTVSSDTGLTAPSSEAAEAIARRFLAAANGPTPFSGEDVAGLRLRSSAASGGLRLLQFQQYAAGAPVYGSWVKAAIDAEGRLKLVTFSEPSPGLRLTDPLPSLSAAQGARLALESLNVEAGGPLQSLPGGNGRALFAHPEGGRRLPVAVELTVFPMPGGQGRLAWRVFADAGSGSYETLVAADDGGVLLRRSTVFELGSGRIFPITPLQPSEIRTFGEGWLSADATVTMGNNIDAYADADGDNEPDAADTPGLVDGRASSETMEFDFEAGSGFDADRLTRAAAVTNAFFHANRAHDYFYELGFREPEGNFQRDNRGRGGSGEDAVQLEVHNSTTPNNARFLSRPDGLAPRMEMGLWTATRGQIKDFSFDATALVHEYTHGVTTRTVGGADSVACLTGTQSGAMGEGWSDYFGLSMYDVVVMGDYITGDLERGVRGAAVNANTRTYEDLGDPIFQVHWDGATWASTLWDIRTAIGAEEADRLIFRALLVTTCSPTFVDARDAILAADDGAYREQLWRIFAARGLGIAASAFNSSSAAATVFNANFDLPPSIEAGNRAPQITSRPLTPATFGEPYLYTVRSVDLDGDDRRYEIVSAPEGVAIDPATGEMTWPSPLFTAHRIQIAVTDGKGGRTVHGFQLRVEANLTPGQPIRISGARNSIGIAYVTVPADTQVLQVRVRGGNGDADLIVFAPDFDTETSFRSGSNETLSIRNPAPGEWIARIDADLDYEDITLVADLVEPAEITVPGEAAALSEAITGETFFKVAVPEGAALLRAWLTGAGDPDLLIAKDHIPLCGGALVSLPCDDDDSSLADGSFELLTLEDPSPGEYYLTIYGYRAYENVTLRVSFTPPAAQPAAAADGAAFLSINAPGGIASLFGLGLAETVESATSVPLPKELGGVRVIVSGIEAALFFVSPGQINFQFPAEILPGSSARVYVVRGGELSDSILAGYRAAAPQVFVNPNDGLPIIQHHADGALVTPENPARAGEALVVYFNGVGLVNDPPPDGEASTGDPLSSTLFEGRATLGGMDVTVLFAGLTPGLVGLSQANLVLPDELPEGPTLPLILGVDTGLFVYASAPVELPVGP
jgi:uncharacterized protein (TIGR03437 family)